MLQMINRSPFTPCVNVLADREGVDTLYVVTRGTFVLGSGLEPAAEQPPPVSGDVYWGEPGASSLKYASEVHTGKRGTDVVLVGSAHAPGGRAVTEMLAALTVAARWKVVRVIGDRRWRGARGGFTAPEPFLKMPLVYERAFGGHDPGGQSDPHGAGGRRAEERNPVGRAFRGRRCGREAVGQPLPNLEDPRTPLKAFGDQPAPTGFGFIAPCWQPRRSFAGTYDEVWKRTRAPFLPLDYDLRFGNAASSGLALDEFLRGGEPLLLEGVSAEGRLQLSIPAIRPRVEVQVAGACEQPPVRLETVLIEPDQRRLSLTWRAGLRCDKRALKIQSIRILEERSTWPARCS
jgi:hypothetical protein